MEIAHVRFLLVPLALITLIGCGGDPFWLPRAHRITIQQGNLLSERQLDEVKVGMDRNAVRTLLGAPVASSTFSKNRWDYLYTRGPAGAAIEAKKLAIFFENEAVSRIDNNADSESGELPENRYWWEKLFRSPRGTAGL